MRTIAVVIATLASCGGQTSSPTPPDQASPSTPGDAATSHPEGGAATPSRDGAATANCLDHGVTYPVGAAWSCACNTCRCVGPGTIESTSVGCSSAVAPADAGADPGADTAGGSDGSDACRSAPAIVAGDYDRTCAVDSDCVAVPAGGSACDPCAFMCPAASIAAAAVQGYRAAFAGALAAYAAQNADHTCPAGCEGFAGPCCIAGACTMGVACRADAD